MHLDRALWPGWARLLQRWGVQDIASFILEAAGPLNILAAQMIYLGQPFLKQAMPADHLHALAALFEDQDEARSFAALLCEGK